MKHLLILIFTSPKSCLQSGLQKLGQVRQISPLNSKLTFVLICVIDYNYYHFINSFFSVDIIIATLEDYFGDYSYLRTTNIEKAITEARDRCARRYISAILTPPSNVLKLKKSNFESPADRRKAAEKIKAEAAQLKRFFRKIAEEHDFLESVDFDSPFDAVSALAEVLNSDSEMLFLDIGTLVKVCLIMKT